MLDTAMVLMESVSCDETKLTSLGENTCEYNSIKLLNEQNVQLLGVTPEKVIVNVTKGNNYLVEYTGNLEFLMRDQHVTLDEALDMIAEANNINRQLMYVVLDESCISKINIRKAKELGFQFVRKN